MVTHISVAIVRNSDGVQVEQSDFYGDDAPEQLNTWKIKRGDIFGADKQFSLLQSDMTATDQALIDEAQGTAARNVGMRVIDRLYAINTRKGFDQAKLMALLGDKDLAMAERLLHDGAPLLAKSIIQSWASGAGASYYTADEIATILEPIG